MSENIQSIANGSFVLGNTNELTFSAGQGIQIDSPSEGVVRIGNDETVLYSGAGTTAASLSEPITNFENIEIYCHANEGYASNDVHILKFPTTNTVYELHYGTFYNDITTKELYYSRYIVSGNSLVQTLHQNLYAPTASWSLGAIDTYITKVVGINRISGSNA